jgi:choloylglycine hydrolase
MGKIVDMNHMNTLCFFNTSVVAALLSLTISLPYAFACTDARVLAEDGSVFSARSMEFGAALDSRLVVRPRGSELVSPAPGGAKGLSWTAKYGYVYMDGFHMDVTTDGLNEAGLGFGALYLPGFAGYETISAADNSKAVSNLEIGAWVLSQFATVKEVKEALPNIHVWGEPIDVFGNQFVPLHYVIHDAEGNSLVLEWVGGKLNLYDQTVGVMTNSPTYDWQMTNLRNYVSLSPDNAKPVKVGGVEYAANGQGSGLFGLPGDPTPPSRMVQTVFALSSAVKPKNQAEALVLCQKLMNRVDLPAGLARNPSSGESDITQWAVFRDHTNKIYYYRTYEDMTLQAVDLKKLDLSSGAVARRTPIATTKPTVRFLDSNSIPVLN